jgi:hypothetical protein
VLQTTKYAASGSEGSCYSNTHIYTTPSPSPSLKKGYKILWPLPQLDTPLLERAAEMEINSCRFISRLSLQFSIFSSLLFLLFPSSLMILRVMFLNLFLEMAALRKPRSYQQFRSFRFTAYFSCLKSSLGYDYNVHWHRLLPVVRLHLFGPKRDEWQEGGENCIMRSFVICTLRQV